MRLTSGLIVWWVVAASTAGAQVLVTGETGGQHGQAVAVAANALAPNDYDTLVNVWAQYGYGLNDRVDLFAAYGNIHVFGETQHYLGVGSNISLLRRASHHVDVSFYNNLSIPVTRRGEASTLLFTLAAVASHPVKLGTTTVTPYGGLNALVPAGQRARGVFTPPETLFTGVVGVAVPLGKTFFLYGEYDPGPGIDTGGIGLVAILPRLGGRP